MPGPPSRVNSVLELDEGRHLGLRQLERERAIAGLDDGAEIPSAVTVFDWTATLFTVPGVARPRPGALEAATSR